MRISNHATSFNGTNRISDEPDNGVSKPYSPRTGVGSTSDSFEEQKQVQDGYEKKSISESIEKPYRQDEVLTTSDVGKYFSELGNTSPEPIGSDFNSILNDPTLSFEEKMALFLFDYLDKAQKDLLSKVEQMDKAQQKSVGATGGNQTAGNDGANGTQATEGPASTNAQSTDSEMVALEKLKLAHEKMNKIFSIVDNILTSNTRTVKDGPIAALKG
jgi:hypothetical protein